MSTKMSTLRNLSLAGVLIGALAASASAALPPGYTWGIANCGPAQTTSASECHLCCASAQRNGLINAIERDGCDQLCDEANFDRDGFWTFFWRGFRLFHY